MRNSGCKDGRRVRVILLDAAIQFVVRNNSFLLDVQLERLLRAT